MPVGILRPPRALLGVPELRRALISLGLLVLATFSLAGCRTGGIERLPAGLGAPDRAASTFTVLSWNAQKGRDDRFRGDLRTLLAEHVPDLVFLQEARADFAPRPGLEGFFARSWSYPWPGGTTVGVLTLSATRPTELRSLPTRHRELGVTAPKVALLSEHTLPGGERLLAVNVHCLNFEVGVTRALKAQLESLRRAMSEHRGPIVLAGDFNSWSERRLELVDRLTRSLGLSEVHSFEGARRTGDLGSGLANRLFGVDPSLPLDRVYYRDLRVRRARVLSYDSSDHAPLAVTFALPTSSPEIQGGGAVPRRAGSSIQ
jgi:endonuclease/exonuclease/phosphatase (EEP) superfamily protein YafD